MKSPLQSSKTSKCLNELKKIIPKKSSVSSFFLFDGTLEIGLSSADRTVVSHTNKYYVWEFWHTLKIAPELVSSMSSFMFERLTMPQMLLLQENWFEYKDELERTIFFYILSKCSDTGYASHGKIDLTKINKRDFINLKRFKCKNFFPFYDKSDDPLCGLKTAKDTDFLLFIPEKFSYNLFEYGKNIGHDMISINHKKLKKEVCSLQKSNIIIYNKHPGVVELYKDTHDFIFIDRFGNKTEDFDKCSEIIVYKLLH